MSIQFNSKTFLLKITRGRWFLWIIASGILVNFSSISCQTNTGQEKATTAATATVGIMEFINKATVKSAEKLKLFPRKQVCNSDNDCFSWHEYCSMGSCTSCGADFWDGSECVDCTLEDWNFDDQTCKIEKGIQFNVLYIVIGAGLSLVAILCLLCVCLSRVRLRDRERERERQDIEMARVRSTRAPMERLIHESIPEPTVFIIDETPFGKSKDIRGCPQMISSVGTIWAYLASDDIIYVKDSHSRNAMVKLMEEESQIWGFFDDFICGRSLINYYDADAVFNPAIHAPHITGINACTPETTTPTSTPQPSAPPYQDLDPMAEFDEFPSLFPSLNYH